MSTVVVLCPHCRKELKLRDRSKIGQKAKCPSCAKSFELREEAADEVVPMELVDEAPAVGVGAQWVPDDAPARPAARGSMGGFSQFTSAPGPTATAAHPAAFAGTDAIAGVQRLKELRRRGAKRRNLAILFGAITAVVVAGIFWALTAFKEDAPPASVAPAPVATGSSVPATQVAAATQPGAPVVTTATPAVFIPSVGQGPTPDSVLLPHQELSRPQLRDNELLANTLAARRGEPIRLFMVPSGVNVVIHLRPAQLWSEDPIWQELRYSLTEDLTNWIAAQLKQVCRRDPQQIEECLISIRLGAIGTEPTIASVVHLSEEAKLSDLIEEFAGEPLSEDGGPRINVASPWAYLVKDTKTFAIVPEQDRFDLPNVITVPNPDASEGVYRLLDLTDRTRPFTVLFEVDDVKRHEGWLFSERTLPVFRQLLNWFGDDVETVGWSVDLQGESAVSEILLRNRSVANSNRLAGDTLRRLESLPRELQSACLKMHPATQGFQAIIGRFPAMIEAYRQATIPSTDTRHVRLTTVLPRKAAPNLALGTLLAWDQSTHTDFSSAAPGTAIAAASATVNVPDKVEDRLKQLTLDGEFGDIPLQDALAYIANETQTQIEIDGNALKDAGFTKNIKIKMALGKVSGLEAIKQIVLYERCRPPVPEKRMCIVIDEAAKTVEFSTEFFAKEQGKTVYPLVTE